MKIASSHKTEEAVAQRIHRKILQIAVLVAIAVGAFFFTQTLAAHSRRANLADAATWFAVGQRALADGNTAAAVEAFQRATAKNRDDRRYVLALARALERGGDVPAAERALVGLRESAPEDPEINLELARLAAGRNAHDEALRYYRNALYAPATAADAASRRSIRLELIRFLLAHDDRSRALGELLAAVADSPNDAPSAVEMGQLLLQAGDDRRAADQFVRALRLEPRNTDALVGAGTAAFHLARYLDARRYLSAAGDKVGDRAELLVIADLVNANDPLGPRLGSRERRRRLVADLDAVTTRLEMCAAGESRVLRDQIGTYKAHLRPRSVGDSDVRDAGLDLFYQAEQIASPCQHGPLDRALSLIARLHAPGA
jgi:tetratricopeptide (TPR) repeat protein